jgi:hypothetical protein
MTFMERMVQEEMRFSDSQVTLFCLSFQAFRKQFFRKLQALLPSELTHTGNFDHNTDVDSVKINGASLLQNEIKAKSQRCNFLKLRGKNYKFVKVG